MIGALAACSSARWRRSMRSCSDWTWSTLLIDTPSCSAWMIAPMKLVSGRHVGARDDVAQRVAAGLADADLGQRPAELVGERALQLLDHLAPARRRSRGRPARRSSAGPACPGSASRMALLAGLDRAGSSQNSGSDEAERRGRRRRSMTPSRKRCPCRTPKTSRRPGRRPTTATTSLEARASRRRRRSPGLPAMREALLGAAGERGAADALGVRPRGGPTSGRSVRSKNGCWSSSSSRFLACIEPSWVRRAWTGSTGCAAGEAEDDEQDRRRGDGREDEGQHALRPRCRRCGG